MNKESIKPRNENNKAHGYWECYYSSTKTLMYKAFYVNGVRVGYEEFHFYQGYTNLFFNL